MTTTSTLISNKRLKLIAFFFILTFLLFDLYQFLHFPLDGDLAAIVVPADWYAQVLNNPLGQDAILHGEKYGGTNRYFIHILMYHYFRLVPQGFQGMIAPIDSLYWASAIWKWLTQIGLLVMLIGFIRKNALLSPWIIGVMLLPLFQTNGFNRFMGIIDHSVTYTFFYGFPMLMLLVYLYPITGQELSFSRQRKPLIFQLAWGLLAIPLALSGPLIPGVTGVLIILTIIDFVMVKKDLSLFRSTNFRHLAWLGFWCAYNLYLGQFNVEQSAEQVAIIERYQKLPFGILEIITRKLGWILLIIGVIGNTFLIKKWGAGEHFGQFRKSLRFIGLFSILYILLLPIGGYRAYRPDIIRYDTIMPITIALIFYFGWTSSYLLQTLKRKRLMPYLFGLVTFLFLFQNAESVEREKYQCEKDALKLIQNSTENLILLPDNCTVLSWETIVKPRDSAVNSQFLELLGIASSNKRYYFSPQEK